MDLQRLEQIAAWRREGKTYREIGERLQLTWQRIEQLTKVARTRGLDIERRTYRISEAAAILGLNAETVRKRVRCLPRQMTPRLFRQLTLAEVEALAHAPEHYCVVCRGVVPARNRSCCGSKECKRRSLKIFRERLLQRAEPSRCRNGLPERVRCLLAGLDRSKPPEWIRTNAACRLTGLKVIQVWWLGMRGVVQVRYDHERLHNVTKKPTRLYDRREMAAIGCMLEKI